MTLAMVYDCRLMSEQMRGIDARELHATGGRAARAARERWPDGANRTAGIHGLVDEFNAD